jgi:hypothetical protein
MKTINLEFIFILVDENENNIKNENFNLQKGD